MPTGPDGWGEMNLFYQSRPNIGALGPRLLFEDGSLQHAGVGFVADLPG